MLHKHSSDRRVLRTKKAIRNAFSALLVEKEVGDITVREIAELADINRKTFYNYYAGVHEVVEEIESEIISNFASVLESVDWVHAVEEPYSLISQITTIIHTDMEFYGNLFTMNGNSSLSGKIVTLLKENIRDALGSRIMADDLTAETTLVFLLNGILAAYQSWFHNGRRQSLDELTETISTLSFHGLSALMEK